MTKKEIVEKYFKEHPNASVEDMVRDLKVSAPTANKYLEFFRKSSKTNEPEKSDKNGDTSMASQSSDKKDIEGTKGNLEIDTKTPNPNPEVQKAYMALNGEISGEGAKKEMGNTGMGASVISHNYGVILGGVLSAILQSKGADKLTQDEIKEIETNFTEVENTFGFKSNSRIVVIANLFSSILAPILKRIDLIGLMMKNVKKPKITDVQKTETKPETKTEAPKTDEKRVLSDYEKALLRQKEMGEKTNEG